MPTLRLLDDDCTLGDDSGEVFACAFTPDGGGVLSAGWNGELRRWNAATGEMDKALPVSQKPLSACAVSPDGARWYAGSMEGMLSCWNAETGERLWSFLAHTRPISAILFPEEADRLVTASWDRNLTFWRLGQSRETQVVPAHEDIVTGCQLTPDGKRLVSWSTDGTLRVWEMDPPALVATLTGHTDRITAAAVAPDGCYAATASRDGSVKLWDLHQLTEASSLPTAGEARACLFLLDGDHLLTVSAEGRIAIHLLPYLEETGEMKLDRPVQCAQLSPSGNLIALGCDDGAVRFVAVEDFDSNSLLITPTQTLQRIATPFQRLFGRSTLRKKFVCTCPVCRDTFDLLSASPGQSTRCPACGRTLRISTVTRVAQEI